MVNPTPLPWSIKPRDGKYYGTEIVGPQNEDVCELWIRERRSAEDNGPSTRELERLGPFGSDEERDEVWREYNCDNHYESACDFANAALIVKAVNNHETLVRALTEMLEAFGPFTLKPMGAPHSEVRIQQQLQIAAHRNARDALSAVGTPGDGS